MHLRRPDGRDLDYVLHVDPRGNERAFLAVWNPTSEPISRPLRIPLTYAGLRDRARVTPVDPFVSPKTGVAIELDASQHGVIEVDVPANGFAFSVFTAE
jgi:hypothetical protein